MPMATTSSKPVDVTPDAVPFDARLGLAGCVAPCKDVTRGIVTGAQCMACASFRGLVRVQSSGDPCADWRAVCAFALPRRVVHVGDRAAVHCPEAPVKRPGQPRFALISALHCLSCSEFAGVSASGSTHRCTARKGVQFSQSDLGYP